MACFYMTESEERSILKQDNNKLTQMLCLACQTLTRNKIAIPKSIAKWWEKHQEQDAKQEREKDLLEYQRLQKKLGIKK